MRDNRNVAMMLLAEFMLRKEYLFLFSLLNLQYADYDYEIIPDTTRIVNQIVTVEFSRKASTLRYVNIQKTRKIRVAYSSLSEYAKKENRNGFSFTNSQIMALKEKAFNTLTEVSDNLKILNQQLIATLSSDDEHIDSEIEKFLSSIDYQELKQSAAFVAVKEILIQIMEIVALELYNNWNNPRYSRETFDE